MSFCLCANSAKIWNLFQTSKFLWFIEINPFMKWKPWMQSWVTWSLSNVAKNSLTIAIMNMKVQ